MQSSIRIWWNKFKSNLMTLNQQESIKNFKVGGGKNYLKKDKK